jgi:hypothetical protein
MVTLYTGTHKNVVERERERELLVSKEKTRGEEMSLFMRGRPDPSDLFPLLSDIFESAG